MVSLALVVVLSQGDLTPPPPPPPSDQSSYEPRTGTMIRQELAALEAELQRYKPKAVWIPLTIGLGGAAVFAVITIVLVATAPSGLAGLGNALLAFFTSLIGIAAAISGVVVAIIFAATNSRNERRVEELQERIDQMKLQIQGAAPVPWKSGLAEVMPLTPVFTF
jgi:hypothetical protein